MKTILKILTAVLLMSNCGCFSLPAKADINEDAPATSSAPSEVTAMIYQINSRFDSLDAKFVNFDNRLTSLEGRVNVKVEEPSNEKQQLEIVGPPDCVACGPVMDQLNASGLFVAVKRADIPDKYLKIAAQISRTGNPNGYPIIVFTLKKSGEHYVCPWPGLSAFCGIYAKTVMQDVLPNMKVSAFEPDPQPIYFSGYNDQVQVSWPGDLRVHLMQTHGYTRSQVRTMSRSQCIHVHSRQHGSAMKTVAKTDRMLAKHDIKMQRQASRDERPGIFVRVGQALFGRGNGSTTRVQRSYRYYSSNCPTC